MASEADLSAFSDSIAQESLQSADTETQTTQKSKGRGRSAIATWIPHSREAQGDEDKRKRYCLHCKPPQTVYSTHVSTNFRRHLQSEHSITVETGPSKLQTEVLAQLQQLYLKAESSDQTDEIDRLVLRKCLNADVINEALVSLIVVQNLAFRAAEWPELHVLCQALNPESKDFVITAYLQLERRS